MKPQIAALALALTGLTVSQARADALSLPGSVCQPLGGSVTAWTRGIGNFTNTSTANMLTVCPLERLYAGTYYGIDWAAVWVNNPAGKTTGCYLMRMDSFGTILESYWQKTTNTGNQALYYTSPMPYNGSSSWGSLAVVCNLPPGAYVEGIFWTESSHDS